MPIYWDNTKHDEIYVRILAEFLACCEILINVRCHYY